MWSNNLQTLVQLCSSGKSGSLFYYTEDGKFMLKTVPTAEFQKFRSMLKNYHEHLKANPNSLMTRFYGLHKIRIKKEGKRIELYLTIMNNLFKHHDFDIRYDLKGSF